MNLPFFAPGLAFFVALGLTPLVIRTALRRGWVARPADDRWHRTPTALMGGIAIYAAASAGWAVLGGPDGLAWIWAGGTVVFASGLLDDRRGLSPAAKLAFQVVGAAALLAGGLVFVPAWPVWVSLPLTLLWVIGITNAVNLLDNMDGLAAGVAAIAALALAALAWGNGAAGLALAATVLSAAAIGFLAFNFQPARVFMGDCGSLFLGFSLAGLALAVPQTGTGRGLAAMVLVPAAVMAVPILDTTLVTVKRLLVGRRVSHGGRDHSSHRLVALGLSERGAVFTLYAVSAGCGILAVAVQRLDIGLGLSLLLYGVVALAALGAFLATVRTYDVETEEKGRVRAAGRLAGDHVLLRAALRHRRALVGAGVDLLLVVAAFLAAFYVRFDGAPPDPALAALVRGLPVVVAVKLFVFQAFGLYRGLWWYAGTPEIVRTVAGALAGSGAAVLALALLFRLDGFPRGALALDALLTVIGLVAVRFAFRGVRGVLPRRARVGARRVLLYGAGAGGALAARELRENPELGLDPVGFVDDDPAKVGLQLQGLRVLGTGEEVPTLVEGLGAGGVVITTRGLNGPRRQHLRRSARRDGFHLLALRVSLEPELESSSAASAPVPELRSVR